MPTKSIAQAEGLNIASLGFNAKDYCQTYDGETFKGALDEDTAMKDGCRTLMVGSTIDGTACLGSAAFCAAMAKAGALLLI